MVDEEENPGQTRLRWIAKANIILGIASLLRLTSEIVTILPGGGGPVYVMVVCLDVVVAGLWLKSGLALRRHGLKTLKAAVVTGAFILGHSVASGVMVGSLILKDIGNGRRWLVRLPELAVMGSRLLIYGVEFLYWPCVLILLLKAAADAGQERVSEFKRSIVGTFLIALVLQLIFFASVLDR